MITQREFDLILKKCRELQPARGVYLEDDYVTNLFLTVFDFRNLSTTVERAITYYRNNRWSEIRTLNDLKRLLSKHRDDKEGNTSISNYIWGYRFWNRVSLLRKLIAYFESIRVTSQTALRHWAWTSDFEKDFKGKIRGMDFAIYKWLVMRQGVETVKPDVHLRRFVESIIRHNFTDNELVDVLEKVAKHLDLKAYELDWRIWESQKGK